MRFVIIAAALAVSSCSQPDRTRSILEREGYTDIVIGGYDAWSCGKDDTYSTAFEATNLAGNRVKGVVCSGVLKGSTIRLD